MDELHQPINGMGEAITFPGRKIQRSRGCVFRQAKTAEFAILQKISNLENFEFSIEQAHSGRPGITLWIAGNQ
jgi:hypothetical protein